MQLHRRLICTGLQPQRGYSAPHFSLLFRSWRSGVTTDLRDQADLTQRKEKDPTGAPSKAKASVIAKDDVLLSVIRDHSFYSSGRKGCQPARDVSSDP